MSDTFNSRELSILVWFVVFIIWILTRKKMLHSGVDLIRSAFSRKLRIIYAVMVIYTIGIVYILYSIDLWDKGQLKNTIFWFFPVVFISIFDITNKEKGNYFKIAVKDIFSFTAILHFIAGVYTFNFFIELLLVPTGILVIGMIAVGKSDPKNNQVVRVLNNLLALFGVYLIGYTIYRIVNDFHSFANEGTLNDFLTPALLSFLFLPLIYFISLYVNHEDTFTGLTRKIKNPKLLRYAKLQTLIHFNFNKKDLIRWQSIAHLRHFKNEEDILNSIKFIKERKTIEKNPPVVPIELGWSPYKAKDFLKHSGIITGYYHSHLNDDEWSAYSSYVNITQSTHLDTVAYYIKGDKAIAKELKLVLNVFNGQDATLSVKEFIGYANTLHIAAMNKTLLLKLEQAIKKLNPIELTEGNRKMEVFINKWPEHKLKGYNIDFVIKVVN